METAEVTRIRRLPGVDHEAESWLGPGGGAHVVATYLLPRKGHLEVFHGRSGYYVIDTLNDAIIVWRASLKQAAEYLEKQ